MFYPLSIYPLIYNYASCFQYCAMVALMIVVQLVDGLLAFTYSDQVNQLASDDFMYESLSKAAQKYDFRQYPSKVDN